MRDALVNQPGFFPACDHVNRKSEKLVAIPDEFVAIQGFTQGLGGHRPNPLFFKARQPFTKTGQAVPAALHGVLRKIAVGVQTVALAHGFFKVFDPVDAAMVKPANF